MTELNGQIVTPEGVVAGRVVFDTLIHAVEPGPAPDDRYVLPGFIDGHVHGGDGADMMDGPDAAAAVARFHLGHGTTTLLPTTVTRPWPEMLAALRGVAEAMGRPMPGATIAGAHLEGPFISPERLGAQPPFPILPDPARVSEAIGTGIVRVVTLAPELPGALEAAEAFARAGIRVSLGHSAASYEVATEAIGRIAAAGGLAGGTHLFNAMGGVAGRAPGLAGALLAHPAAHAELILDGLHVHPGAFRLAHAALGRRLMLVTDAMRGAGLPDGDSELGGQRVRLHQGAARLPDGTLAGSVLTMDEALRQAIAAGTHLADASRLVSANAARFLGLHDRGAIHGGSRADLVVTDAAFRVREVWIRGRRAV